MRGYRADWLEFTGFCAAHSFAALPAKPGVICLYLKECMEGGKLKLGSIKRRVSSIAAHHEDAGFDTPTTARDVKRCLVEIGRMMGRDVERKEAVLVEDMRSILRHIPNTGLVGIRDRAMLPVCFQTALKRAKLVKINVEDLIFKADGRVEITIKGESRKLLIPAEDQFGTAAALRNWLQFSGIASGPIFRRVLGHHRADSTLSPNAVTDQVPTLQLKKYAEAAGFDSSRISSHSLRRGHITSRHFDGDQETEIQKQSLHVTLDGLANCIQAVPGSRRAA